MIFDLLICGVHDLRPFCKSDLLILIFDLQSSELFDLSSQKTGPDTRVGAFESPMSQLSQEFLFVFIAPLEKFSQPLEVESFCHFEAEITEYST